MDDQVLLHDLRVDGVGVNTEMSGDAEDGQPRLSHVGPLSVALAPALGATELILSNRRIHVPGMRGAIRTDLACTLEKMGIVKTHICGVPTDRAILADLAILLAIHFRQLCGSVHHTYGITMYCHLGF